MTERELLEFIATHYAVKVGPNDRRNQYGHLELWWAADSVAKEAYASFNPWMMLGNAENSYSLAAIEGLRGVLDEARKLYNIGDVK